MLGRDHALTGAMAFAAVAPLLHVTPAGLAAGVVLTAGAGLLCDIDEPGSTISRQGGFVTRALAWVVRKVSGGHRKGTHSLTGIAVFTALAYAAVLFIHDRAAKVALWLFLALLLGAACHALRLGRHRLGGHHGDALGVAAAAAMVYWHAGLRLVPLCIAIGAAAHIAGDAATEHGCPLLYPLSRHDYHVLPRALCFKTGKVIEHWLVSPLLLSALAVLLWRDTSGIAHHVHATLTARSTP